jgi:hypothetical protein
MSLWLLTPFPQHDTNPSTPLFTAIRIPQSSLRLNRHWPRDFLHEWCNNHHVKCIDRVVSLGDSLTRSLGIWIVLCILLVWPRDFLHEWCNNHHVKCIDRVVSLGDSLTRSLDIWIVLCILLVENDFCRWPKKNSKKLKIYIYI